MNKFIRFLRGVLVAAGAISVGGGVIALADYAATQGLGTTFGSIVIAGTKHYMQMLACDPATPSQCVAVSAGGAAKVDGSAATQPVSGTVTANAGTNLNTSALATSAKQPALGTAGSASTDVLTVQGIASMTPLLATLSAETTKVIGTVRNVGNAGAITDFVGQAATAPANAWLTGATFFTTPTTLTNGQASPLQMDNAGNLLVNIKAGAGSGGTAIADKAAWTVSSTNFTLTGGEFTTGGATACATAQACTVGMTVGRAFFTDTSSWAGTVLGAPSAYGTSPGAVNVPGVNAFVTNTNANGSAVSASSSPVVIASDQAAVAVKAASAAFASGSIASGALASGSVASGAIASGAFAAGSFVNATAGDPCMFAPKTNLAISQNGTSSVQLVALSGATAIYVCSLSLIAAGATTVALTTGTGTACVTGNAAVIGSTTANIANSMSFAANGGLTIGSGQGTIAKGAASSELCMILGTNVFVSGNLTYVQI